MMRYYDVVVDLEAALQAGSSAGGGGGAKQVPWYHPQQQQQRGADPDDFHSANASMAE